MAGNKRIKRTKENSESVGDTNEKNPIKENHPSVQDNKVKNELKTTLRVSEILTEKCNEKEFIACARH